MEISQLSDYGFYLAPLCQVARIQLDGLSTSTERSYLRQKLVELLSPSRQANPPRSGERSYFRQKLVERTDEKTQLFEAAFLV